MLNNAEIHALKAILDAAIIAIRQEGDDGDPVYHEVNINEVNPFHHKRVQSDVYDRLSEKGFIDGSITQFGDGIEQVFAGAFLELGHPHIAITGLEHP